MAGSLIKITETEITSSTSSVSLTGIDSTYDVYKLVINDCFPVNDNAIGELRVTKSGTAQSDANYDYAFKVLRSDTTFTNLTSTNSTRWDYVGGWSARNNASEAGASSNAVVYLFNFPNSSEYSFITNETANKYSGGVLAPTGGGVHTVQSASDGVNFQWNNGNIDSGIFTLYGLKK